jgi:hypothetical protein
MSEPRRIVLVCEATSDVRAAVEETVMLAARWHAALHGVFIEDENLFRLARLPFGRQATLSPSVHEPLNEEEIASLSSALGAAMRQALEEMAGKQGLEWSFDVLRDLPRLAALAEIEGDILVVHDSARPFSGEWQPRSAWSEMPEEVARTILLRRQPPRARGLVAVVAESAADVERLLPPALDVAGGEDEIAIVLADDDADAVRAAATSLAATRPLRVEAAGGDLLRRVERLDPSLLVVAADSPGARDLLAGTRCDVLLVGAE